MQAGFLFPFQNKCDQNAGTWWCRLFLAHLTTLFRLVKEIHFSQKLFARLVWDILEPPSVVFSVCQNFHQNLVFCWHVYDRCTNCKFINWYPDVTIWMLVQCTAFLIEKNLNYYHIGGYLRECWNKCFWRAKCFGKGTSSVYAVAEIKQEISFSSSVLNK